MEICIVTAALTILSILVTGASSLQCYQCHINPLPGRVYDTTPMCTQFDYSSRYVVDCPHSTMCMKQQIYLDIQDGVRVEATLRDCAQQKHEYQYYRNGQWAPRTDILEPYSEGCFDENDKDRVTPTRHCYCRSDLCNSSPNTNHEGYTDIMGVIVVFNLMKYINSLR